MTREEEIKKAKVLFYTSSDDYTFYNKGFEEGAKWADKTLIEKACEWLKENINVYAYKLEKEDFPFDYPLTERIVLVDNFDKDFKAAMEE